MPTWEPRITIVVPTSELSLSLYAAFKDIPGEKGFGRDGDRFHVTLSEFPKTTADLERVLEIVRAWLAEVAIDSVTVESRWEVRRARRKAQGGETERRVLTWKLEESPEDAPDESPEDVGPAWLDTFRGEEVVDSEQIGNGEWITRAEARRLAEEHGYDLSEDD
jgi:hypothetical protein